MTYWRRTLANEVIEKYQSEDTYTEELDVVEDLVVESKVVAGDHINTSILLELPVLQTESLSLSQELITRDLVTPVSLSGLLEVTELSHTRETQDGAKADAISIENF